jgi:predicted ATPase/DNA-binding winged helix-turn-helix (wHTH) protein
VSDLAEASAGEQFLFGPFCLLPARQLLLDGGTPVRLGSRALEILIALVERAGELISKDDLIARVWRDTSVDEGALRVHIAALRRAIGDGQSGNLYIANIPGRGYQFVAAVTHPHHASSAIPLVSAPARSNNLPASLTRLVGRHDVVRMLAAQLPSRRFMTIVGPGGIGKTAVALAVADELASGYPDAVGFVDLAPLADPRLVTSTVASALGLPVHSGDPMPGLIAALGVKQILLILDSCEHVIEAVTTLAEAIFAAAPNVHILATSREPMRAEGEHVHRLPSLGIPPPSAGITAATALDFPAIQLFVERAVASMDRFEFDDANAPLVADICRRLDGIALAIELAAGRVETFGVAGVAAGLDDRFHLLTHGKRTALPRHQTLLATLDWSYALLPERERVLLCHLAVFAGDFTLAAARAVESSGEIDTVEIVDIIANLVAKSLLSADVNGAVAHYRLLETTRAYAQDRLTETGQREAFAQRHAEFHRDLLQSAEAEFTTRPTPEWVAHHGRQIDNVRAALDWAFSPAGDADLAVALTIAAVPLWMALSLIEECRARVEQALAANAEARDAMRDMRLYGALGAALIYTKGQGPELNAAWTRTLEIAESLGHTDYRLRALWGLWVARFHNGEHRAALALAERFHILGKDSSDPADPLIGDRLMGSTQHLMGELDSARQRTERMLNSYVPPVGQTHILRFHFDQRVQARATHAHTLWLQGYPDQAMRIADTCVNDARSLNHAVSMGNALIQSPCPVAFMTGDLETAERLVASLLDHAARQALDLWLDWGRCFEAVLLIRRGNVTAGVNALRSALVTLRDSRFLPRYTILCCELAEGLCQLGEVRQGLTLTNEMLARTERTEEYWCIAELLRLKAELLLWTDTPDAAAQADHYLQQSLTWARRQGALSWELRTAMSIARSQACEPEALAQLQNVYDRFTEGFSTADLQAARKLLTVRS